MTLRNLTKGTVPENKTPPRKRRTVKMTAAVKRLHDEFRQREAEALEALKLARTWISDGAYLSGATALRSAAFKFEAAQRARNDAFTLMTKAGHGDGV